MVFMSRVFFVLLKFNLNRWLFRSHIVPAVCMSWAYYWSVYWLIRTLCDCKQFDCRQNKYKHCWLHVEPTWKLFMFSNVCCQSTWWRQFPVSFQSDTQRQATLQGPKLQRCKSEISWEWSRWLMSTIRGRYDERQTQFGPQFIKCTQNIQVLYIHVRYFCLLFYFFKIWQNMWNSFLYWSLFFYL